MEIQTQSLAKPIELIEELERRSFGVTLHNKFMPVLTAERRRRLAAQRRAIQENEAIKTLLKNQYEITLTSDHKK